MEKCKKNLGTGVHANFATSRIISEFLDWDDRRIRESLDELRATGKIPDISSNAES